MTEQEPVRFGVIADPQYADKEPRLGRDYRASLGKLGSAVAAFNGRDLDFVVTLGDVIDEGWESFDAALEPYARLRAPARFVLGNHDFAVPDHLLGAVPGRLGLSRRHHDFAVRGTRFIILDQTEVSVFATPPGSPARAAADARLAALKSATAPNAESWNGGMSEAQLDWLGARLDAAGAAGEAVVVLGHYPVTPGLRHAMWGAGALAGTLGRARHVLLYLAGHDHAGGLHMAGDLPCVTLEGMVETTDETAFAVVTLSAERIRIEGCGRATSRDLPRRALQPL